MGEDEEVHPMCLCVSLKKLKRIVTQMTKISLKHELISVENKIRNESSYDYFRKLYYAADISFFEPFTPLGVKCL